jgi:ubiquinone/menaquinone biosynthesis C-methylase UbiE/uncharacterized protein YbaR (Trm112 family)
VNVNIPAALVERLRCPRCRGVLTAEPPSALACARCAASYPVINGAPVLIDPERSVFAAETIIAEYETSRAQPPRSWLKRLMWAVASKTPHVTSHGRQRVIAQQFADRLAVNRPAPTILVVGCGTDGIGVQALRDIPGATLCEFDVYLTDSRMLVADLLSLPFESGSFDCVVAQGVLEHVIDPQRAAAEMHRVLKPGGLVFSTTPFVLGVHLPIADYTRFSRLGLIRLFNQFMPIECDVIEGAGVSLAYSLSYFGMAVSSSIGGPGGAKIAKYAVNYLIFFLPWIDRFVRRSPISMDAASSYFYVGRRSETTLSDHEIVAMFKGAGLCPW